MFELLHIFLPLLVYAVACHCFSRTQPF